MGKYDFIKTGNLLYWHDPDNGFVRRGLPSDFCTGKHGRRQHYSDFVRYFGSGGFAFGIITDKYGQKSQRGFFALESGT